MENKDPMTHNAAKKRKSGISEREYKSFTIVKVLKLIFSTMVIAIRPKYNRWYKEDQEVELT